MWSEIEMEKKYSLTINIHSFCHKNDLSSILLILFLENKTVFRVKSEKISFYSKFPSKFPKSPKTFKFTESVILGEKTLQFGNPDFNWEDIQWENLNVVWLFTFEKAEVRVMQHI